MSAAMRGAFSIILACCAFNGVRAQEPKAEPPRPSDFLSYYDSAGYLAAAEDYLDSHGGEPDAPHVAFEAMMVASIYDANAPFVDMRRRLLFDYSKSFESTYLLSTFDAKTYGAFLQSDLDFDVLASEEKSQRRVKGITHAIKTLGKDVVKEPETALRVALLANRTGAYRLTTDCKASLADAKESYQTVAAILFDRAATNREKLSRLSGDAEHCDETP